MQELVLPESAKATPQMNGLVVVEQGEEIGSVLPASSQPEEAKKLRRKLSRAHNRVVKASMNCLLNARDAGDAGLQLNKQGRGILKDTRDKLGISERTLRVYMQIATNWPEIEIAIQRGEIKGQSIREALSVLKKPKEKEFNGSAVDDDEEKACELPTPQATRRSLHIICKNSLLEFAMAEIAVSGFSYHSTVVGVAGQNGSTETLFLINGVSGGAEPESHEFCDWFVLADGTIEDVKRALFERAVLVWADGEIKCLLD